MRDGEGRAGRERGRAYELDENVDVDVFEGDVDRWGKTREYFAMRTYRLPIGKMKVF